MEKIIKNYSYSLTKNGDLDIFIVDLNGNEFCVARISGCKKMRDFELGNLALEILEENNYVLEI